MKVPFVDLHAQYLSIKEAIDEAIATVIKETAFIGGRQVKSFEEQFSAFTGLKYVIGCANGTDSLEILMKAMDIGVGDEVIVPAISWISTSESVTAVGATPVFVDIEEDYYTINPELIAEKITRKTKAIIPVHLYGHPANMPAIMSIAHRHGLKVIEDCAQAHAASINGQAIGSFGDAASFSFYPGKNLGAYGDAGCMATNNPELAETARMIANHGQLGKHNHLMEGRNSRLDGIHAAVLSAKLPHLEKWTASRARLATLYNQLLGNSDIVTPKTRDKSRHVFHLYVIRSKNRNELKKKLGDHHIETAIHYPKALPFLPCYESLGYKPVDFPVAFACQDQILSLPMFAELTEEQVHYVAEMISA